MGGDSLNANLAVMRSAFSTATAAGKVPDGRTSASISTREAGCNVVEQNADVKSICFILNPCLSSGLSVFEVKAAGAVVTGASGTDIVSFKESVNFDPSNFNILGNVNTKPDKFRLTSAALRLSCVNSAQFNNGWFEAIRVPTDYAFGVGAPTGAGAQDIPADWVTNSVGITVPAASFENNLISSNRWCNHPSYVTGKLTDLYKHQFYLQPTSDREFQRSLGDNVAATAGIDTNFDCVAIRVFTTAGTTGVKNAVHYHVVHHFEMMYDAGSDKCKYHSHCFSAPGMVSKVDSSIKRDPKASIIRSPNSYGVNTY